MYCIPPKAIWRQIKKDWIGKDVYRGVSLSYALMATQFGHFALGFIPAILGYLAKPKILECTGFAIWPFTGVTAFWLCFEILNFYRSILKPAKGSKSKKWIKSFPFEPSWKNLVDDLVTDIGFFGLGAGLAGIIFIFSWIGLIIYIAFCVVFVRSFLKWYKTKMFLQEAHYPFQFRLSQWETDIGEENKKNVLLFLEDDAPGKHLLVFGNNVAEKLSLCVGIATELSFRHQRCTYTTAMKLNCMFYKPNPDILCIYSNCLWTWQNTSVLIIDDINPSHSIKEEIFSCNLFFNHLNNQEFDERNKEILSEKKVIWILGNDTHGKVKQNSWEDKLAGIGVDRLNMKTINL